MRVLRFSLLAILCVAGCGSKPSPADISEVEFRSDVVFLELTNRIDLTRPQRPTGTGLRLAQSATGDFYVLDGDHHRVLRYTRDGALQNEAGGSGLGSLEFNGPIDIDSDGQMVWVLDRQNRRLVRLNNVLNYVEEISLVPPANDASAPLWFDGVGCSTNGDVFLLDKREPQVVRISPSGEFLASYGGFGSGSGRLERPTDLDAGADGTLYVTDGRRLLVFDRSGNLSKSLTYNEPLIYVEGAGKVAWLITASGRLLRYADQQLSRVAIGQGGMQPVPIDLAVYRAAEPALLDSELAAWLMLEPSE
jgi:hypothetical protein